MSAGQSDATLPLHLNVLEVIFLADNLKVDDTDEGALEVTSHYRGDFIGRALLRKIGSLYVEFADLTGDFDFEGEDLDQHQAPIFVTEKEAWLIKSKIRTGDLGLDGMTNIGVRLSCKLFELVNKFDTSSIQIPFLEQPDASGDRHFTPDDARELRWEQEFERLKEEEEVKTHAPTVTNKDKAVNPADTDTRKAPHPAPPDLP